MTGDDVTAGMVARAQQSLKRMLVVVFILGMLVLLIAIPAPYQTIPLPKPPKTPACKVCHCAKTSCHRECGEEAMCNMRCEGLCKR